MRLELDISLALPGRRVDVAGTISPGVTAVFGPSGCGKTTLLRAIAGLTGCAGAITCDGTAWQSRGRRPVPPHRRDVAMVFQDARLFDHLSVEGNLRFVERRRGRGGDDVRGLLDLGPLLTRRPAQLSGGERQRVALAQALLARPKVLMLDEPLTGLDGARRDDILPYLERLRDRQDVMTLLVSHDLDEVTRLANDMWVMDRGGITAQGGLEDILNTPNFASRLGPRRAGAVITGRLGDYDQTDDLTQVCIGDGRLYLPGRLGGQGDLIRLRIPAHDIILSLHRPVGVSALGQLPVTVTEVVQGKGPGVAVGLRCADQTVVARITRKSCDALGLVPGMALFAMVKATAIAPLCGGGDTPLLRDA